MNKLRWKKIESKGLKHYLLIYGTRMGCAGAVFAALFRSVGMTLIYEQDLSIGNYLNDLYNIGPWIFITGYASAYLTWSGNVKRYN